MSTNNKCKKTIGKVDKAAVEASRELSAKRAPIKMLEEQNRDYESIITC
jgi:phage-related minor tail protein